ncbi:MAG: signal transduction histidine kinase [Microbacterium sp.]|nr:signal transduction histidine kinase [Microbacterium sp.]
MSTMQPVSGPTSYPGKTLGIIGMILAFPVSLIGLVISIVALVQSRKAGYQNVPAIVGIIVGAGLVLVGTGVVILLVVVFGNIIGQCADLGPGTHYVDGVTYRCSVSSDGLD